MHYRISTLTAAIAALLMSQTTSTPLSTTTTATMYIFQTTFGSDAFCSN